MNFDAMADGYYASRDPQYTDWDSISKEQAYEDMQWRINNFDMEDETEDSIHKALKLADEAKEYDIFEELDWTEMENQFEQVGVELWRLF